MKEGCCRVRFADKPKFFDASTGALVAIEDKAPGFLQLAHVAHDIARAQRQHVYFVAYFEMQ